MEIKPLINPSFPPEITRCRLRNRDGQNIKIFFTLALLLAVAAGIVIWVKPNQSAQKAPAEPLVKWVEGYASWYRYQLPDGWTNENAYVCATRDFPRYSFIKVTNLENGYCVVCKKIDYGPDFGVFPERIVDLSPLAFSSVANLAQGVFRARIELWNPDDVNNATNCLGSFVVGPSGFAATNASQIQELELGDQSSQRKSEEKITPDGVAAE